MKGILLLGAVLCLSTLAFSQKPDDDDHNWENFQRKFQNGHRACKDSALRKKNFESRCEFIKKYNALHEKGAIAFDVAVNHFADWTPEEIGMSKGYIPVNATEDGRDIVSRVTRQTKINKTVPTSIDWRTYGIIGPIRDQQQCGCCYSFAAVAAVEAHYLLKYGGNFTSSSGMSDQQAVDCSTAQGNLGCDGGNPMLVYQHFNKNGGISLLSKYPYKAAQKTCAYKAADRHAAKVKTFTRISSNEEEMKKAVGTYGPISIAINSSPSTFTYYKSGVYKPTNCDPKALDHAVNIIGYGEDVKDGPYWLVRNTWGTDWGENGYMRIARGVNACGLSTEPSFPIIS